MTIVIRKNSSAHSNTHYPTNVFMDHDILLISAVMHFSRQKPRLEAAKVMPRPRLDVFMPHLGLVSVSILSYVTISLFITFIHSSFVYMCLRPLRQAFSLIHTLGFLTALPQPRLVNAASVSVSLKLPHPRHWILVNLLIFISRWLKLGYLVVITVSFISNVTSTWNQYEETICLPCTTNLRSKVF